jgi:thiamine kinase-like enzyme
VGTAFTSGTLNDIYPISSGGKQFVLRVQGRNAANFTDWTNEVNLHRQAGLLGFAPQILLTDSRSRATLMPACAQTLQKHELTDNLLEQLAQTLRRLHSSPCDNTRTSYRAAITKLAALAGISIESDPALMPLYAQADQWDQYADFCWCHQDLNPGNILRSDDRIVFIDWEYSSLGHPLFDLASVSLKYALDDQRLDSLVHQYQRDSFTASEVRDAEQFIRRLDLLWYRAAGLTPKIS